MSTVEEVPALGGRPKRGKSTVKAVPKKAAPKKKPKKVTKKTEESESSDSSSNYESMDDLNGMSLKEFLKMNSGTRASKDDVDETSKTNKDVSSGNSYLDPEIFSWVLKELKANKEDDSLPEPVPAFAMSKASSQVKKLTKLSKILELDATSFIPTEWEMSQGNSGSGKYEPSQINDVWACTIGLSAILDIYKLSELSTLLFSKILNKASSNSYRETLLELAHVKNSLKTALCKARVDPSPSVPMSNEQHQLILAEFKFDRFEIRENKFNSFTYSGNRRADRAANYQTKPQFFQNNYYPNRGSKGNNRRQSGTFYHKDMPTYPFSMTPATTTNPTNKALPAPEQGK
jgi:hypothetical protein